MLLFPFNLGHKFVHVDGATLVVTNFDEITETLFMGIVHEGELGHFFTTFYIDDFITAYHDGFFKEVPGAGNVREVAQEGHQGV